MKRLGILAAVFVVLLGVLFIQRWQRSKIVVAGPAETVQIDPDKVTRVSIQSKDGVTELARDGNDWKLTKPGDFPANAELVTGMLKAVGELKLVDVISTNPATRGTYQVDSTGTAVELWTGETKALALVVGKSTSDWSHTFVRRAESNEVYRADGVITYQFNRKPEDWRDKSILKLQESDIQRIALAWPKENRQVAVVRSDSTHWQVRSAAGTMQPGDSTTVARFVTSVSRLQTVGFATPEESMGRDFGLPDFQLAVDASGGTKTVRFVEVDENKVLAKLDGRDTIFSLYQANLQPLEKDEQELLTGKKAETAAKPAAGKKKKS